MDAHLRKVPRNKMPLCNKSQSPIMCVSEEREKEQRDRERARDREERQERKMRMTGRKRKRERKGKRERKRVYKSPELKAKTHNWSKTEYYNLSANSPQTGQLESSLGVNPNQDHKEVYIEKGYWKVLAL